MANLSDLLHQQYPGLSADLFEAVYTKATQYRVLPAAMPDILSRAERAKGLTPTNAGFWLLEQRRSMPAYFDPAYSDMPDSTVAFRRTIR